MSDFREFIAWRTAHNGATRQFKKTREKQAVYITVKNGKRRYERTTFKMWMIMKPGKLAYTVGELSKVLDPLFSKGGAV